MNQGCQVASISLILLGIILAMPFTIFYSETASQVKSADEDFNCDNCVVNHERKDCIHNNCTMMINSCWCCTHLSLYEYNSCEVLVYGNTDTCTSDYTKLLCYKQKIDYERDIRTDEMTYAIISAVSWCVVITNIICVILSILQKNHRDNLIGTS